MPGSAGRDLLVISPQSWPEEYRWVNNPLGTFCFSHPTMATLLDNHQPALSWKYYTVGPYAIATAPNWFRQICVPDNDYQQCTGQEWKNNVDLYPQDVLRDIGACKLREHDLGGSGRTEFRPPRRSQALPVVLPG